MSILAKLFIAAVTCTVILAGCQDQEPVSPVEPGESSPTSLSKKNVIQSVTGSGHLTLGEFRTFTFSARKYADGSVDGEWQLISRTGNGAKLHGNVLCLTIVGNKAWIGGEIERGPAAFSTPPNNHNLFQVIDNGEGANAPPDQISLMSVGQPIAAVTWWCTAPDPHLIPILNIEQGNVQIRP